MCIGMHTCMQLYVLIYISFWGIACIYAYTCINRRVIGMYVHRYLHMFMSTCMSLDVHAYSIWYSHDHITTDSAVDTHLNIDLSTMMHKLLPTIYAGALCLEPTRNTHEILLI